MFKKGIAVNMKEIIKFLAFLCYATSIFFMPNNIVILLAFLVNITIIFLAKINIKNAIKNLLAFLPFILFTVVINCILDYYINAIWVGIKLLLVCNITFIYSRTITVRRVCKNNFKIVYTIKNF